MIFSTDQFVSIVFPIRNESAYIEKSLCAILSQDYPPHYMEILIADGMSTDNTREIISNIANQHPKYPIRVLDNPGKFVPTGLNLAIQRARGEILIRVDGHTVISPDYVSQCVAALHRSGADNVGGRMNALGSNLFGKVVALATSTSFGIGGGRFHLSDQEEWVDTVYMGAWPRQVFERIGLFDEELVRDQDDEFNYRLRAEGGKILLSPKIKSEYTVRSSPSSLWHQYFQYGYWKVRVLQKHPRQMSLRQFVPPVFVLALILSLFSFLYSLISLIHPSSFINHPSPFLLSLLIPLLYLLANLSASLWIVVTKLLQPLSPIPHSPSSINHDPLTISHSTFPINYYLFLPLVFAILHLSYGSGFLLGLVKFASRWGDKQGKVPHFLVERFKSP
jgi:cellulose synthase/poly-beta-1,6-N-acetylglucosamine synthase-like glycosyltransferase